MNARVKQLWIDDLRAHPKLKGTGALRKNNKFCCLGRLCELHRKEVGGKWRKDFPESFLITSTFQYLTRNDLLPEAVVIWAGLSSRNPNINELYTFDNDLAALNDDGKTFLEIADLIEKYL